MTVAFLGLTVVLLFLGHASISRVSSGQLFLFSLPFDTPATRFERDDAVQTASSFLLPAMIATCFIAAIICWFVHRLFIASGSRGFASLSAFGQEQGLVTVVFTVATLLDLATTLWFFHKLGVAEELHPGIRLMGYAYGRTVGPLIGKTFQWMGLLALATVLGKFGAPLLWLATGLYVAAALYNASNMLW